MSARGAAAGSSKRRAQDEPERRVSRRSEKPKSEAPLDIGKEEKASKLRLPDVEVGENVLQYMERVGVDMKTLDGGRAPRGHILVLGLTYLTAEGALNALAKAKPGTRAIMFTDYARIRALEKNGFIVTTISMGATGPDEEKQRQRGKFLSAYVGKGAAISLMESPEFDHEPFDYIVGEYARMPLEYAAPMYNSFVNDMLPQLIRQKRVSPRTKIILPNYHGSNWITSLSEPYLELSLLAPKSEAISENPLLCATNTLLPVVAAFPSAYDMIEQSTSLVLQVPAQPFGIYHIKEDAALRVPRVQTSSARMHGMSTRGTRVPASGLK